VLRQNVYVTHTLTEISHNLYYDIHFRKLCIFIIIYIKEHSLLSCRIRNSLVCLGTIGLFQDDKAERGYSSSVLHLIPFLE
jgi:hypothetical protein